MDAFFELLKALFAWIGDNLELVALAAFGYWLICGYVRWCRRFDRFSVNLLRVIAVMKLLNAAGDNSGAVRLYCDLIYSDDLLLFSNAERAVFIGFAAELIGCDDQRLAETCNQIAGHSGRCYQPFRHLRQRPGEFFKTLFH